MNDSHEDERPQEREAGQRREQPPTTGTSGEAETPPAPDAADESGGPTDEPGGTSDEPGGTAPGTDDASGQESDTGGESTPAERPALPSRLVFRITRVSLLVILVVAVCISPVAASLPWLSVLYLIPLGLILWVVRMRTVVDESGITARTLVGSTRMTWSEIKALRLDERRWVRAVTTSDRQVRLPALRVRDVPRLAAMSRGRIQDPTRPAGGADG